MSQAPEVSGNASPNPKPCNTSTAEDEKAEEKHVESAATGGNINYDDDENEPELHARTYVALAAMFLLNMVQVLALQGPPAAVCGQQPVVLRLKLTGPSCSLHSLHETLMLARRTYGFQTHCPWSRLWSAP